MHVITLLMAAMAILVVPAHHRLVMVAVVLGVPVLGVPVVIILVAAHDTRPGEYARLLFWIGLSIESAVCSQGFRARTGVIVEVNSRLELSYALHDGIAIPCCSGALRTVSTFFSASPRRCRH